MPVLRDDPHRSRHSDEGVVMGARHAILGPVLVDIIRNFIGRSGLLMVVVHVELLCCLLAEAGGEDLVEGVEQRPGLRACSAYI